MCSYLFAPSVGGIETVSSILAHDFKNRGAEVKVVTATPAVPSCESPFEVVRQPNPFELVKLVKWSDVVFHNNISLNFAWPLLIANRPWVVAFHTWVTRSDGKTGWRDFIKQNLFRRAKCISISRAISDHLPVSSTIVGNPYNDAEFVTLSDGARARDLVFLGRLVSDKGVDLLVEALATLNRNGVRATLTIIGKGPAEVELRQLARKLNIEEQIEFVGERTGLDLVKKF